MTRCASFPEELGKLGFVFNFITYGGHQIDGLAAEEFATALRDDGMLALARLQRKFRLLESPYRTPQSLVGGTALRCGVDGRLRTHGRDEGDGQGLDAAPAPRPDRGPDQAARGVARHLGESLGIGRASSASSCGRTPRDPTCSSFASWTKRARRWPMSSSRASRIDAAGASSRSATSTRRPSIRAAKRLMTLVQLFLIHRYRADSLHYLTPTDDNQGQTERMQALGIFTVVRTEIGADHRRRRRPRARRRARPPWRAAAGRARSRSRCRCRPSGRDRASVSRVNPARRRPSARDPGWPIGRRRFRRGRPR